MMAGNTKSKENQHPMIPVPEAIQIVIRETAQVLLSSSLASSSTTPKRRSTVLSLSSSSSWKELLNQVLDKDVLMEEPGYPPYNASIMDGYAIRTKDYDSSSSSSATSATTSSSSWTHRVIDKVYAGDDVPPKHQQQQEESGEADDNTNNLPVAYYITTGAVVPDSFNCVVPIEECKVSDDKSKIQIQSTATIADQKWIRPIGCDIPAGSVVLPRAHKLDPVSLGLLKQSGASSIEIKSKVVVGVLSTGNELILGSKDDKIPGKIPDVNRPILLSLFDSYGYCDVIDLGNERDDDVNGMASTIQKAVDKCDVIVTTGGISMGETDIVEHVLVEKCFGTLHFGRMHMKPGKPTTFVTIPKEDGKGTTIVFAMPGNPVSATVCSQLLVKPCLDLLFQGIDNNSNNLDKIVDNALLQPEVQAKIEHDIKLDMQRPEYHRVKIRKLNHDDDGGGNGTSSVYVATTTGVQRSSRLMSCRDAQGLLVLPKGDESKPKALAGEIYPVLVISEDFKGGMDRVQLKDSIHLNKRSSNKMKDLQVAVVEVLQEGKEHLSTLNASCKDVREGLSGSKSGPASIVSKQTLIGQSKDVYDGVVDAISKDGVDPDVIVVSYLVFDGSFQYHLDVSSALRQRVKKPANALALQARQGSASQSPASAIYETVVGYVPETRNGSMLICLPSNGLKGGLGNVRGLLKHALNVARGKPHNHHHTHANHNHAHSHAH